MTKHTMRWKLSSWSVLLAGSTAAGTCVTRVLAQLALLLVKPNERAFAGA